jgi:SnoaL-like domain
MTKWVLRLALIAGLFVGGVWGWRTLFPGPEQVIKRRLEQLAKAASTTGDEGLLAKAAHVQKVTTFFTPDVEIVLDIPGQYNAEVSGLDELTRMVAAARSMGKRIKVEFLDVSVAIAPDQNSAQTHMVGQAIITGERGLQVQELKAQLRKVDGQWLVNRVETVRTLR